MDFEEALRRAGEPGRDLAALATLARNRDKLEGLVYFELTTDEMNDDTFHGSHMWHAVVGSTLACSCPNRRVITPKRSRADIDVGQTVVVTRDSPLAVGAWGGGNTAGLLELWVMGNEFGYHANGHIPSIGSLYELGNQVTSGQPPATVSAMWWEGMNSPKVPLVRIMEVDFDNSTMTIEVDRHARIIAHPPLIRHAC